jgi:hypothetical protein
MFLLSDRKRCPSKEEPHAKGTRKQSTKWGTNGYVRNVDALVGLNDENFQNPAMRLRYSVGGEGYHLVAMLRLAISHESG